MLDFRTTLADWFAWAANRLSRKLDDADPNTRYVDLAPTDQADPTGVYSDALRKATDNPRVMNIALTGPYGSGKSSIIKSFLKKYKRPVLQISLAAFLPEAVPEGEATVGKVSRQEIERSILQQMLYGADAKRLPLSRFRRIQNPGRSSAVASLCIIAGVVACWHLFKNRDAIMTGAYFQPFNLANWFNLVTFAIGGGFVWKIIHHLYIASFGISLKSISLKDIEIAPKAATEESILNRHMDEIIYFFQATRYDLVVIEDLDRFNNSDIFVTLREINSLVNANLVRTRHIRFLYALRDDMFVNTDRTKFFEFIIPVIPIINSSNSIDKMLEQGKRLSLNDRLDHQFLKEVSRYLNDLRLIQNIFNEYAIYVANIDTENENNLDDNKLLAILIYKNVFPSDFESLHRGKGNLAEVLRNHDRFIATSEARYTTEIARLEALIEQGEKQLPNDLAELRRMYAMAIVEALPEGVRSTGLDYNNMIPLNNLANDARLEAVLSAPRLSILTSQGHHNSHDMTDFRAKYNPAKTFQQRMDDVNKKSVAFKDSSLKEIRELRAKLGNLRMAKFNEVIRENASETDALFEKFGDDADLARYLVLEGHLDDTYYQYTSLFHSGRLSPSDNKFLIHIRSFRTPDPDFQIDNPKEVIAAMRDEDFSRSYVLNVTIVDCLLADSSSYGAQNKRLLAYLSSDFDNCQSFLSSYYARGVAVAVLISELVKTWPGFVDAALTNSASIMHVTRMMSHLSNVQLMLLAKRQPALSSFVSEKLADILAQGVDVPTERLQPLGVEVADLAALEAHPAVMRVLFEQGLYELSIDNLNFIFRIVLGLGGTDRPREQNYTLVLESGSDPLLNRVDGHFDEYLRNVLLLLPDNSRESISTIQRVIGRSDVEFDSMVEFLEKQSALFSTLDQVPDSFHASLFQIEKIQATWENCLNFLTSGNYDAETLTQFLNSNTTLHALAGHKVPDGTHWEPLRKFIIENDGLRDEAYAIYVTALPNGFKVFPKEISASKTKILVNKNIISFSADNLSHLSEDLSLSVTFVAQNIDDFFEIEAECGLEDSVREKLLEVDISDENRLRILREMNFIALTDIPARAAIVGGILARTGKKFEDFGAEAARAVILSSRPFATQITLFNLFHELFDDGQVREILKSLPNPLPDIKPGFGTPRIESSEVNLKFVTWLKDRGFISSWRQGGFFDEDIRMNMFRK